MFQKSARSGFTLIEMLIVIVIVGILAAALIPRLTGIQARARDTARTADMRNISTAVETYFFDHGSYPVAVYASTDFQNKNSFFISSVFAQTPGSSLDKISPLLTSYLQNIPSDPEGLGVQATSDGSCLKQGKSYAYYTDPGDSLYSITSTKESKKGNASTCGDTIDRAGDGIYEKVGNGLTVEISGPSTDPSCFQVSETSPNTIIGYYNNKAGCPKDIVIPMAIDGVIITSIGNGAFKSKSNMTSLTIGNSVKTIGENIALYSLNLSSVTIGNKVESIGNKAFYGSFDKLTSVTIGNSVKTIGDLAFFGGNFSSIIIPDSVTSIGVQSFAQNRTTSITISNNLTSVGAAAFQNNGPNKNSFNITGSATQIGGNWVINTQDPELSRIWSRLQ